MTGALAPLATFDESRRHRFWLRRDVGGLDRPGGLCVFVMLNPSTADESVNDPTIRRCIGFASRWGYGTVGIVNLWSFRATDPRDLIRMTFDDDAHPRNVLTIDAAILSADRVVAAWGAHVDRVPHPRPPIERIAADYRKPLVCLGRTAGGHPRHPLYVAARTEPVPYL